MPDGVNKTIPKNTWYKVTEDVAIGITTGQIYKRRSGVKYFWTYRLVSEANPDPTDLSEGKQMFVGSDYFPISLTGPGHIWIYAKSIIKNGVVEVMI